jgi:hypothetical protein
MFPKPERRRKAKPDRSQETKAYMDAVAGLGCLACRKLGLTGVPAHLHHPRASVGLSERGSDMEVYGLCPGHHTGHGQLLDFLSVHGNSRAFHAYFGTDAELSRWARELVDRLRSR